MDPKSDSRLIVCCNNCPRDQLSTDSFVKVINFKLTFVQGDFYPWRKYDKVVFRYSIIKGKGMQHYVFIFARWVGVDSEKHVNIIIEHPKLPDAVSLLEIDFSVHTSSLGLFGSSLIEH